MTEPFQKLIDSLARPPEQQAREGKAGDPQLSALCQFLVQSNLRSNDVLVDFGAGNGVLPEYLNGFWPSAQQMPEYWAIDLPDGLDKLSLPSRVHNNSRKYATEEFYFSVLPAEGSRIAIVVIRNVLHELDIKQTAKLFDCLRQHLQPNSQIYIQDMAQLRMPERGNVPWSRDLLERCLHSIGFKVRGFDLPSHSGVLWYAILCQSVQVDGSGMDCLESIVAQRKVQFEGILGKLKELTRSPENSDELVTLEHEFSCLSVQLDAAVPGLSPISYEPRLGTMRIPTRSPNEEHLEYACSTGKVVSAKSGLIAMISSKQLLDFPKLFASATSQLAFGGYSNRPLFSSVANITALKTAMSVGAHVRVMVVDPISDAARLRSMEPVYTNPDGFLGDIRETIHRGRLFFEDACEDLGRENAAERFELRASTRVPRWSYFIVDDTCYLSFYSIGLTGSAAPCFVYRALPDVTHNYFHIVQKEFSDLFSEAKNLL